ncbi:MAG: adenylate/guanylate cyclase domain-containing protein [Gammaproteobacteria bacterium]|jgi:class 3 adenylate cyclase
MAEEQANQKKTMDRNNRTWLCTVLFMDIVGYSTLSVDRQMMVKQSFSTLVSDALRSLPGEDCIKLDTGDGLAMCYLGAPEEVLYVAVGLRDAFIDVKALCETCYSVRMGINLGPVKILEDINGQRNTIGDGINAAQRIMSFARPNQLLVSRTYYDVVSCLSEENPKMFSYVGIHNDKHVREFAVYEVIKPEDRRQAIAPTEREVQADAVASAGDTVDLDQRILRIVQEQLALAIGPMAGILIKRALKKSHSIDQLYRILAEEIPTEQERERFLSGKDRSH